MGELDGLFMGREEDVVEQLKMCPIYERLKMSCAEGNAPKYKYSGARWEITLMPINK